MSYLAGCGDKEAKSMIGFIRSIQAYKEEVRRRRMNDLYQTLQDAKTERSINRFASNGYSKSRNMKKTAIIPTWVVFDKEYGKYFDPRIPFEDRRKEQDKFLDRFGKEVGNLRVND